MRFKELLPIDNDNIVDLEEMAEYVLLDGVTLKAVVTYSTAKASSVRSRNFGGLYGDYVTLWCKTIDYIGKRERIPRQGEICFLNGKRYEVHESGDFSGITRLNLFAYRQETLRKAAIISD